MHTLKIISWNIAGGHRINSLDSFDYEEKDLSYFADLIKSLSPDVICLQESHTAIDNSSSDAHDLSEMLSFDYVLNSPASPSHITKGFQLGTAIISNREFSVENVSNYPDPNFDLFFSDGRKGITHHKNLQLVSLGELYIANTQMLPMRLFGHSYDDKKEGSSLAKEINEVMEKTLRLPLIFCGDFNFDYPLKIYPALNKLRLKDAIPDEGTRPNKLGKKKTPDHIFYSPDFKVIDSKVIPTDTDHYLCFVEFEV